MGHISARGGPAGNLIIRSLGDVTVHNNINLGGPGNLEIYANGDVKLPRTNLNGRDGRGGGDLTVEAFHFNNTGKITSSASKFSNRGGNLNIYAYRMEVTNDIISKGSIGTDGETIIFGGCDSGNHGDSGGGGNITLSADYLVVNSSVLTKGPAGRKGDQDVYGGDGGDGGDLGIYTDSFGRFPMENITSVPGAGKRCYGSLDAGCAGGFNCSGCCGDERDPGSSDGQRGARTTFKRTLKSAFLLNISDLSEKGVEIKNGSFRMQIWDKLVGYPIRSNGSVWEARGKVTNNSVTHLVTVPNRPYISLGKLYRLRLAVSDSDSFNATECRTGNIKCENWDTDKFWKYVTITNR